VGEPLPGHSVINAVAIGEANGVPVVISGGDEGTVRVWDLGGDRPAPHPAPVLHVEANITALVLADGLVLIGTERGLMAVRLDFDA